MNRALPWIGGVLAAALLAGCAPKPADSPQSVAERFYDFYIGQKMKNGLPSIEQTRQLTPILSRGLQDAITKARREQDKFIIENPDEKPPWVEGDLFTSLFEGATSYEVRKVDETGDHADVLVALRFVDAKGRRSEWTDRLVLVRENTRWVVENIEYGGNWDFANQGNLKDSLAPLEAAPDESIPANAGKD
jgi:hypothetical protein